MSEETARKVARELVMENDFFTKHATEDEIRRNYEYDLRKFVQHSSTASINPSPTGLESFLTAAYHAIERALALEHTRAGFGQRFLPLIFSAISELERDNHARFATAGARGSLREYVRFHDEKGYALPPNFEAQLREFAREIGGQPVPGGTVTITKDDLEQATHFDYDRFVKTRYSVRHLTGEPVSQDVIRQAVSLATKTPRTCNREMRRVYTATDAKLIEHVLSYHNGNKGFGHRLGALLIVTADLREMYEIGERNQGWIDGGLFAMSLVYALHAARLGTCLLNWSVDCDRDQAFRDEFAIPDNEVIITFIGVGHVPEKFQVACSPGPDVEELVSEIKIRVKP